MLVRRPNDFEKLRLPKREASDQCGADSVDQLMINTSNQVCFVLEHVRSGLI